MMVNRLYTVLTRAKEIYQEEGILILIKRMLDIAVSATWYENSVFYVYEHLLEKGDEANYRPRIQNVIHKIVETIEQFDELQSEGFDLSFLDINQSRYRLEKGAILFLVFINHEFASTSWAALSEESKNTFNRYPYKVDFVNNEVCGGGTWVNPKYRGQGLHYYTLYKKEEYLLRKGAKKIRSITLSSNIASQRTSAGLGEKLITKARYIRIFGLQFWREKPVKPVNKKDA